MRLEIDIPKEFEGDYRGDKFKDFFSRVMCDIENGVLCGNYEKETAEMFLKAFDESRLADDVDFRNKAIDEFVERLRMNTSEYDVMDGFGAIEEIVDAVDIDTIFEIAEQLKARSDEE